MSAVAVAAAADQSRAGDRLPVFALLALATTGFTAIMTETLPAGLLPQIARGLHVSRALAGQLVTAYATGSHLAVLPLTAWTQGLRRRPVLLAAIVGFLVFNALTALSQSVWLTLAARFLAELAAGLAWGVLSGYARRLATPMQQGRALALAMLGTPLALSLGVPAGAYLGAAVGWRAAFLAISVTSTALIGWVRWGVSDFDGQPAGGRFSAAAVFAAPGVRPVLLTVFAWMTAHNLLYTYIAPLAARAGLEARVSGLLLGFGLAAVIGIAATGLLVDKALRRLVLASLGLFGAVALALAVAGAGRRRRSPAWPPGPVVRRRGDPPADRAGGRGRRRGGSGQRHGDHRVERGHRRGGRAGRRFAGPRGSRPAGLGRRLGARRRSGGGERPPARLSARPRTPPARLGARPQGR